MSKLYFRYGTMGSGKSLELLKVAHNYEEQGRNVLIFSPAVGNRTSNDLIFSRVGFTRPSIPIYDNTNIFDEVLAYDQDRKISCVLVDEAQFLNKKQIIELTTVVDHLEISVIAFGLKNDFRNELFEGSYHLLARAESIEEIKTICTYCEKKAFMVLKLEDGKPVYVGEQIVIDNEENRNKDIEYKPVCRKCYYNSFERL